MHEALHQITIKIEIIIGEMKYTEWYHHKKNKFFHSIYTGQSCSFFFFTSLITGVLMGEMSILG
jgi:hypothetical protein